MSFLIIMVLLLVVMYVLMIRPQRQRQQQQQRMIEGARVGDDVLTTGGIYGTVTQAEGDDIFVEIACGVTVHLTRRGIAAVLPPEEGDDEGLRQFFLPRQTTSRTSSMPRSWKRLPRTTLTRATRPMKLQLQTAKNRLRVRPAPTRLPVTAANLSRLP